MTLDEIACRFAEACRVLRLIPTTDRDRPAQYRSCMPMALRDADSWSETIERLKELHGVLKPEEVALLMKKPPPVRETATLQQITLLEECLSWNWYLLPDERIAIWGVAQNAPKRRIAKKLRCSRDKVERLRRDGLKRIQFALAERCFTETKERAA